MMRRDVFQAIADPKRRAILNLLAGQRLTLNDIAGHFPVSRPAISKHVKILVECGLVVIQQKGRERYCEAQPEKLEGITKWVDQYQQLWDQRLDRLDDYLKILQQENKEARK